jgi:CRISPR-associated protein Cas5/CasD subtype I-E
MRALIFPLEGPVMALQGAVIDARPEGVPIPMHSMVTGLVACALGIPATEGGRLQDLSDVLEHAIVVRRRGRPIQDLQKANLRGDAQRGVPDQPRLNVTFDEVGRGVARPSGSTGALTVQLQWRPWLVDAAFTVILTGGDLEAIRAALIRPRWPLYLGRTGFLPSRPLAGELVEGDGLAALARGAAAPGQVAWVPAVYAAPAPGDVVQMLPGRRDWRTRRHGGASLWTRIAMPREP